MVEHDIWPVNVSGTNDHCASRKKRLDEESGSCSSNEVLRVKEKASLTKGRMKKWFWALFIVTLITCMVWLVILGDKTIASTQANNDFLAAGVKENQMLANNKQLPHTSVNKSKVETDLVVIQNVKDLDEYECVGWRQTAGCTPWGKREYDYDKNCSALILSGVSGYCEVRNTRTGEVGRVMAMHCSSLLSKVSFECDMFKTLLSYSILSTSYEHDPNFSYTHNQEVFRVTNKLPDKPVMRTYDGMKNESTKQVELSFDRGIVVVVYEKLLLGVYANVRSLRAMGCKLPIEMWYKTSEMNVQHSLLRLMVEELNVYLRVIEDPRATSYYTKIHAVFYSAFDNVLLLDADNFAVRDPNYLFGTQEYVETGAMFWPDYWKPGHTIFNIHEKSYVWQFFGLDYVDMFEQESGQVMINRRMHYKALNVLMYYGFSFPRHYESMRLAWGDKDLFRFAWLKSNSSFHMTPDPPGSAGTKHADHDLFCGVTMVQHDPEGHVIFLHRNTEKLTYVNNRILWTHIQQYKPTSPLVHYRIRGLRGGKPFPQFKRCYGRSAKYDDLFMVRPMSAFPFENLENDLLRFAAAGAAILENTGYGENTLTSGLTAKRTHQQVGQMPKAGVTTI